MIRVVIVILLTLSISSCKKDCSPPVDPPKHHLAIDGPLSKCSPIVYELNSEDINFLPDTNFQIITYFNNNDTFYFNFYLYKDTIIPNCHFEYHTIQSIYESNSPVGEMIYALNPFYSGDSLNYEIIMGPFGQLGCESIFEISTEIDLYDLDSIQLLGKTYYEVYYRTVNPVFCCSEMYYNKQYGVVGFKWLNEWYVLETDSL